MSATTVAPSYDFQCTETRIRIKAFQALLAALLVVLSFSRIASRDSAAHFYHSVILEFLDLARLVKFQHGRF